MKAKGMFRYCIPMLAIFISAFPQLSHAARKFTDTCTPLQKQIHHQTLAKFSQRPAPTLVRIIESEARPTYIRSKGELAYGPKHQWSLEYTYYKNITANSDYPTPIIFMFSGISGITILDRHLAHYFVDHGYSVVLSHHFDPQSNETIENVGAAMVEGMFGNLALVDFFTALPEIDGKRVGALGISFGGIRAIYHSVVDKRIKASILMVTGGPLADIMSYSQLEGMDEMRAQHMSHAGLTSLDNYRSALSKEMRFNLSDWTCRRSNDDYFMFISQKDKMVPTASQWHLYDLLGGPKVKTSNLGHIQTPVWAAFVNKKEMLQFFNERV